MQLPEDFIPDFTKTNTTGFIASKNSHLQRIGNLCYVSLYDKINVWNIKTQELVKSFGVYNHNISCFKVFKENLIIGYDNGCIEINSKIIKFHTKKITNIIIESDYLISSSFDGSIICYDLVLDEIKYKYKGNSSPITNTQVYQSILYASCLDKTIKMWNIEEEMIFDLVAFNNDIFNFVFKLKEGLVVLNNGDSFILDLASKQLNPFERFKNPINMKFCDNKLIIHCMRKTTIFSTSNDLLDGRISLKADIRIKNPDDLIDFDYTVDQNLTFISKRNTFYDTNLANDNKDLIQIDFGFHQDDIIDIKIIKNKIFTLSKNRFVYWMKNKLDEFDENSFVIEFQNNLNLVNATCFAIHRNNLVLCTKNNISILNLNFFELVKEVNIVDVSTISVFEDVLIVCSGSEIIVLDQEYNAKNHISAPDNIIYSSFNVTGDIFAVSTIDNRVYCYTYPQMDLRLTLYGHSLPVRSFSMSNDSKLIFTAGVDKLIKIWGLDFGECRKSLVGNSKNIQVLENNLFMFSDKKLEYFQGFEKLKGFKISLSGFVKMGTDYLIHTFGLGLDLFLMDKLEYTRHEESSEIYDLVNKDMVNAINYDEFLNFLEKLEIEPTEHNFTEFYEYLEKSDFIEITKYFNILDNNSISLILRTLELNIDKNLIVNGRILFILFKSHKENCISLDNFRVLKNSLLSRMKALRELVQYNNAELDLDEASEFIDNEFALDNNCY